MSARPAPAPASSAPRTHARLIAQWTRIGAGFNAPPARKTPDLELLLLDTARAASADSRIFIMAMTWLASFGALVARHRLARLIATDLEPAHRPAMGLLLDLASERSGLAHLDIAARACAPAPSPRPLFDIDNINESTRRRAERAATAAGMTWNLWVEHLEHKPDALRPAAWVIARNPGLQFRADFRGDLRASILAELMHDAAAGDSELELARRAGATRAAIRAALSDLELAGRITRKPAGRKLSIALPATRTAA